MAKGDLVRPVDEIDQREVADIAHRPVKEARAHGAVGFNDGRYPGCVALDGREGALSVQGSVVIVDAPKFRRRFGDKAAFKVGGVIAYQAFEHRLHYGELFGLEIHLRGALLIPEFRPIEGLGRNVGGQKTDLIKPYLPGGIDDVRPICEIEALDDTAAGYAEVGLERFNGLNSFLQPPEGAWHPPDRVVDGLRPVQGDDNFVNSLHHFGRISLEEQAGRQDRDPLDAVLFQ